MLAGWYANPTEEDRRHRAVVRPMGWCFLALLGLWLALAFFRLSLFRGRLPEEPLIWQPYLGASGLLCVALAVLAAAIATTRPSHIPRPRSVSVALMTMSLIALSGAVLDHRSRGIAATAEGFVRGSLFEPLEHTPDEAVIGQAFQCQRDRYGATDLTFVAYSRDGDRLAFESPPMGRDQVAWLSSIRSVSARLPGPDPARRRLVPQPIDQTCVERWARGLAPADREEAVAYIVDQTRWSRHRGPL